MILLLTHKACILAGSEEINWFIVHHYMLQGRIQANATDARESVKESDSIFGQLVVNR